MRLAASADPAFPQFHYERLFRKRSVGDDLSRLPSTWAGVGGGGMDWGAELLTGQREHRGTIPI